MMRRAWLDGFFVGVTFIVGLYAGAQYVLRQARELAELDQAEAEAEFARFVSCATTEIAEA